MFYCNKNNACTLEEKNNVYVKLDIDELLDFIVEDYSKIR